MKASSRCRAKTGACRADRAGVQRCHRDRLLPTGTLREAPPELTIPARARRAEPRARSSGALAARNSNGKAPGRMKAMPRVAPNPDSVTPFPELARRGFAPCLTRLSAPVLTPPPVLVRLIRGWALDSARWCSTMGRGTDGCSQAIRKSLGDPRPVFQREAIASGPERLDLRRRARERIHERCPHVVHQPAPCVASLVTCTLSCTCVP